METEQPVKKHLALAIAGAACVLTAGAAQAGNVYWSIGISAPPVGTVISNTPVYSEPAPVVYSPPVYVEPAPVVYAPPPRVYYRPVPVYYRPAPAVVYRAGYYPYGGHRHWHDRDGDGRRDEYGNSYRGGRWAPVPVDPRRRHHQD
jgi:hypothetical protein